MGDIAKTACGYLLHGAVCCVVIINQIHKAGSHQMGEMAAGSHHLVVFPVIQNKGNGSYGLCNRNNAFCIGA